MRAIKRTFTIRKCGFCALLALLLWGGEAGAQRALTLDECRELALRGDLGLKSAQLEVEGAQEAHKEAFTKYFPTVSATGMGFEANRGMAGVSILNGLFSASFVKNGMMAGVTAVQPLFAGGQIVNGNRLAKVGVAVKREQLRQERDNLLLEVEQYFWQARSLAEKLQTIDAATRQLDTICRDVSAAVEAGVAMRNDLLQAELKRNSLASDRLKVENGLRVTKMLLGQRMDLAPDSFQIADEPLDLARLPLPGSYRVDHREALSQTVAYRLLEQNVRASELRKRMEIGKYLPTVGVGVGYLYYGIPNHQAIDIVDNHRSFGVVFASVAIPLSGWWGGAHAIRQRAAQVRIAEYSRERDGDLLLIQMEQLWNELDEAYRQAAIAGESVEKAEENLRLSRDAYEAGTSTMSDLLDAQTLLRQSRDQYVDDMAAYLQKRTKYLQATGR